jgi:hypothetical protein
MLPHRLTLSSLPGPYDLSEAAIQSLDLLQDISRSPYRIGRLGLEPPYHAIATRHRLHATEVNLTGPAARLDLELFDSMS